MHDHRQAVGATAEHREGVLGRGAGVDDEWLAQFMRELDLRFECPQLKIAWRAVAVVVESGLADRNAARM
jgi:hypothetical protein